MTKALITTIDGTLCDHIGIAWVRYLGANKLIDEELFEQHEHLIEAYSDGLLDPPVFVQEWTSVYANIAREQKESEFEKYARKFSTAFIKTIPPISFSLIKHFKDNGYKIFALTFSPVLPAKIIAEHMGINELRATELEVKKGKYTGEILTNFHKLGSEGESIVHDIIIENGIDTSKSFALGSTLNDLSLLQSVAYPIVLNPKGRLADYAKERGFWIANEENVLALIDNIEKSGAKSTFEQMKFIYETGVLKYTPRSGWAHIHIENPESVAEHVFRASVIAYLLAIEENADPHKCASALVMHELGECRIGDVNKITAKYWESKKDAEKIAVNEMVERLDAKKKQKVLDAVNGFNDEKINSICRDADLLENLVSAREYEFKGYVHAREWIKRITPNLKTATAKKWALALSEMDPHSWWFGIKTLQIR